MKNERGITLVELLAVLAIFGIIMTLFVSVFINGTKVSNRNATNQKLQQEANYIVETIRKEYLKFDEDEIRLKIDNINQTLELSNKVISEGYNYEFINESDVAITIDRTENYLLNLEISKGDLFYTVETTFSKLQ